MSEDKKVSASEFEDQFQDVEGIRIVLRVPEDTEVDPYPFKRQATGKTSLAEFKRNRLSQLGTISYEIVAGDGSSPHGKTNLDSIRESYE